MLKVAGHSVREKVFEGASSFVYRARRDRDGLDLYVKVLRNAYPSREQRARFVHEFEVMRSLDLTGVVRVYELLDTGNGLAYTCEDFGGTSLAELLRAGPMPVERALTISIEIVKVLGQLHSLGIIHKDITPGNIVFDPAKGVVKLIDFGTSISVESEHSQASRREILEGTLAYVSPEQTGRMNRLLDYRTDYYSLGATMYEALTGRPPFDSTDPLELVHAHIAVEPAPPDRHRPEIGPVVSSIVIRLLAKNAEDRYQTERGLRHDLELCLDLFERTGEIPAFDLGLKDLSATFRIPQRLYGREAEIATLLGTFDRVKKGAAEVLLFSGGAGVGKTALVNEVYKPAARDEGYFISGKFDQLQRNVPYGGLIQAFRDLMRQILTEDEGRIAAWRSRLGEALENNGQLIVDVIPEVELVIGPQPAVPMLGGNESFNRFGHVLQRFISVFATAEHPLALFIDDLHWADQSFLRVLPSLVAGSKYFLLVGAFREEEVDEGHPLRLAIDAIRNTRTNVVTVALSPLDETHVSQMVGDALASTPEDTGHLAAILYDKSGGNAFFLRQLLQTLHREKLIEFDAILSRWKWDDEAVERLDISDNVLELMAGKILSLPESTREVLQLAASIGSEFDLHTLSLVHQKSLTDTATDLSPAISAGLVAPVGDAHTIVAELASVEAIEQYRKDAEVGSVLIEYRFLHDRVQQAAYHLIPAGEKKHVHLRIGKLLLKRLTDDPAPGDLFEVVDHLNVGRALLDDKQELEQLAHLNYQAGERARSSSAYAAALDYLEEGIALLPDDAWTSRYDLALGLYTGAAEAAYLSTDFSRMRERTNAALANARTHLDAVPAHETRIHALVAQQKLLEAVNEAKHVLKKLGVSFPAAPANRHILVEFLKTKAALRGKSVDSLKTLPAMSDPEKLAAMRIMMAATAPVYYAQPNLFPLIAFEMVRLSAKYGNASYSAYGYGIYGVLLCSALGDIPGGYSFGRLSLELVDDLDARDVAAKVNLVFNSSVRHWMEHLSETLEPLMETYHLGLQTGDLEYATLGATAYGARTMHVGHDLDAAVAHLDRCIEIAGRYKQTKYEIMAMLDRQVAANLISTTESPWRIDGQHFRSSEMMPVIRDRHDETTICMALVFESMLGSLFGNFAAAYEAATTARSNLDALLGTEYPPIHHFYEVVSFFASRPPGTDLKVNQMPRNVAKAIKKMEKWAAHSPSNYSHKLRLMHAEQSRAAGRVPEAMQLYDEAISLAGESGFIQEQALACERAADFHVAGGRDRLATLYLRDARHLYQSWGADAKVRQLDLRYPELATESGDTLGSQPRRTRTVGPDHVSALDLATVMKASQAISGEIMLDRLLQKMMRIVLENAGAQRGLLILQKDNMLFVEADGDVDRDTVKVMRSTPYDSVNDFSKAVVNYVARTQEHVVLSDATTSDLTMNDEYVQVARPKSILCMPLLNQGVLIGVLYLENNRTTDAFTPSRLEVLRLLSSEIAISIENARLYTSLEQKVEERTTQLRKSNRDLNAAYEELKAAQTQLIHAEKMVSLGQMTAGIAHEIKNPLNFVNNFASSLDELLADIHSRLHGNTDGNVETTLSAVDGLIDEARVAAQMINKHGTRADSIIRSMMQHARSGGQEREPTDINALVAEYVNLTYHGMRAQQTDFNVEIETSYSDETGIAEIAAQDIGRVLMNLLNNAYYAVNQRVLRQADAYQPTVSVSTRPLKDAVEITVRDNGLGIPVDQRGKIFEPFFTTKPSGEGTGLGLSLSYDIVVHQHGGKFKLDDAYADGASFIMSLPRTAR